MQFAMDSQWSLAPTIYISDYTLAIVSMHVMLLAFYSSVPTQCLQGISHAFLQDNSSSH